MPVTSSNFSLLGWGTGATLVFLSGTQRRCQIQITAGTLPSPNPNVGFLFTDYVYPSPPLSLVKQNSLLAANTGEFSDVKISTATNAVSFFYLGVPLAGKIYIFIIDTLGV